MKKGQGRSRGGRGGGVGLTINCTNAPFWNTEKISVFQEYWWFVSVCMCLCLCVFFVYVCVYVVLKKNSIASPKKREKKRKKLIIFSLHWVYLEKSYTWISFSGKKLIICSLHQVCLEKSYTQTALEAVEESYGKQLVLYTRLCHSHCIALYQEGNKGILYFSSPQVLSPSLYFVFKSHLEELYYWISCIQCASQINHIKREIGLNILSDNLVLYGVCFF